MAFKSGLFGRGWFLNLTVFYRLIDKYHLTIILSSDAKINQWKVIMQVEPIILALSRPDIDYFT